MKKILLTVLVGVAAGFWAAQAYASDWDVAGKVLTGVEGVRIITGQASQGSYGGQVNAHREYGRSVWVPHYVLVWEYVPAHREYSARYGRTILLSGRYVQRQVERGGHWEVRNDSVRGNPDHSHDGWARGR